MRKSNNTAVRMQRFTRALRRQHHIAGVHIENPERQGLINWRNCKSVAAGPQLASGICDIAHHWTIYLAVFCRSPNGECYIKAEEIAPQGQYTSAQLGPREVEYDLIDEDGRVIGSTTETEPGVIDKAMTELVARCNQTHVIGRGWIASPVGDSLTEEQADRVFEAVGAWQQACAAA